MSLKNFHLVFILIADAMTLFLIVWLLTQQGRQMPAWHFFLFAMVLCEALITIYLVFYIRKVKQQDQAQL